MKMPLRVVISGASSGLGLALARHYLEHGATIAAFARRGELLQTLSAEFPGRVFCYALDVRESPAVQHAANDFITRGGVPDMVIANAGVSVGTLTEYAEDIDAFQQVMDINVLGIVKTFQPFVAAMRAAQRAYLGRHRQRCKLSRLAGGERLLCLQVCRNLISGIPAGRTARKRSESRHDLSGIYQDPDDLLQSLPNAVHAGLPKRLHGAWRVP